MKIAKEKMCRLRFMLWQISNVANEPKISYIKNGRATQLCVLQSNCPTKIFYFPFSIFNL